MKKESLTDIGLFDELSKDDEISNGNDMLKDKVKTGVNGNARNILLGVLIGFLFCAFLLGVILIIHYNILENDDLHNTRKDLSEFLDKEKEIQKIIEEDFLYEQDEKQMFEKVYSAMLSSLEDPYTDYYTKEEYERIRENLESSYSVEGKLAADTRIGYVKISAFTLETYTEFTDVVDKLITEGAAAFIYDVRNNPGGLFNAAIDVLDYLLPEGTIASVNTARDGTEVFLSDEACIDLPCIILVNEDTISAAELFAGVLQNSEYACLVGEKTFGKGVAQKFVELSDGSAIRITYCDYFLPDGANINGHGIEPDHEVLLQDDGDWQLDTAIKYLQERIGGR